MKKSKIYNFIKSFLVVILLIVIFILPNNHLYAWGDGVKFTKKMVVLDSQSLESVNRQIEDLRSKQISNQLYSSSNVSVEEKTGGESRQVRIFAGIVFIITIVGGLLYDYTRPDSVAQRNYRREDRKRLREQEIINRQENERVEREEKERERQRKELERQDQKNQKYENYVKFRAKLEQMPIYERWKQDVIKKCGNKCQLDKSHADRYAEVHHIDSLYSIYLNNNLTSNEEIIKCKKLWDKNNGIVLCKECHDTMESSKNRQAFILNNQK